MKHDAVKEMTEDAQKSKTEEAAQNQQRIPPEASQNDENAVVVDEPNQQAVQETMPPSTPKVSNARKSNATRSSSRPLPTNVSTKRENGQDGIQNSTSPSDTSASLHSVASSSAPLQPPPDGTTTLAEQDLQWVEKVWRTYDDIIFISLFTQLGMVFRIGAAHWFAIFDDTFRSDSALFINLPLNCMSAFILGFLCDGRSLMQIIEKRMPAYEPVSPASRPSVVVQGEEQTEAPERDTAAVGPVRGRGILRLRRRRGQRQRQSENAPAPTTWTTPRHVGDQELRDVQLQAYQRRIASSTCLVLFPTKKEDVDVMEHYVDSEQQQQQRRRRKRGTQPALNDAALQNMAEEPDEDTNHSAARETTFSTPQHVRSTASTDPSSDVDEEWGDFVDSPTAASTSSRTISPTNNGHASSNATFAPRRPSTEDYPTQMERDLDQILQDMSNNITSNIQGVGTNLSTNISRMQRVSLADGWDRGTTAKEMSADLLLGLRDGFCGALSSFSSWNSSMVALIENGDFSQAIVGYVIGMQLPIVSYRFGQHMAVYLFIWRCRRENRSDEKRGYGIRLRQRDHSLVDSDDEADNVSDEDEDGAEGSPSSLGRAASNLSEQGTGNDEDMPSVRAIATAIFVMSLVTQLSAIFFFTEPQQKQLALSFLFSPLGVLTRWRLSKWNRLISGFPVGTFTSNMLSCALNGSLGRLLAGNPGRHERIFLVSVISGFAGSLSSVSTLVVEVLAGIDPLLFRFDGFTYSICTVFWGMLIGIVTSARVNWAENAASGEPSDTTGSDGDL